MLTELHIENIAVIERAGIEFFPGLNILTGETGAGKSIIIDALDAVLGGRSSREIVRTGSDKATASAVFTGGSRVDAWLEENGADTGEDSVVLMRRIGIDGKSTCRVNGNPVSAAQLRELGNLLLDIHGQNDGRQLMDEMRHREYLDRFGSYSREIEEYERAFGRFRSTVQEIERLSIDDIEKERLTESLRYQISELEGAAVRIGEEEELISRRELLKNAGKLTEVANGAYEIIYSGDGAASVLAGEAEALLGRAAPLSDVISKAAKSVSDARYLLEDAAELLRDFKDSIDFSAEEYDRIETRLKELGRLRRKYGSDAEGLLATLEECKTRLDDIEYSDDRITKLTLERDLLKEEAKAFAQRLTIQRREAADRLQKRVTQELRDLNMPFVRFEVEFLAVTGEEGFGPSGQDEIRFLMSANAGEEPGRISKIASGGELSRIMLAMKSVFAEKDMVPTLVFDEIDAGVSGIAAQRVGEKLGSLSKHKQVICVTHLPQIAAMADAHYLIAKSERGGRTFTSITELDREGRKQEIARLHGGDNITATTLLSAEEQLSAADKYKAERT